MHGRCNPLQQPVCRALHMRREDLAVGCQPANSKASHVHVQNLSRGADAKASSPMQQTTETAFTKQVPLVLLQHHIPFEKLNI